jgi:5-formyltetrahydrofolate cyclo-ligase
MKSRRRALSPEERTVRNSSLIERLTRILSEGPWETICLYHPSDGEPDLRPLTSLLPAKAFYFPAVNRDEMGFFRVRPGEGFVPGAFGILEPEDRSSPLEAVGSAFAVCVPGVVFDRRGNRIGRGRGYYDRYFASIKRSNVKIGTAWSFQLSDVELALKPTDVRMDLLVTDEAVVPLKG